MVRRLHLSLLVAGLIGFGCGFYLAPEPPAPSAASPRPVPEPGFDRDLSVFGRWRQVEQDLAQLSSGGATAAVTPVRLRQQLGVNLPGQPVVWIYWVLLGRWLDGGAGPPPRVAGATVGPPNEVDTTLFRAITDMRATQCTPQLLFSLLENLALHPAHGPSWLALGWCLDMEGLAAPARKAYTTALSLLAPSDGQLDRPLLCAALARALYFESPDRLHDRLFARVKKEPNEDVCQALMVALEGLDVTVLAELYDYLRREFPGNSTVLNYMVGVLVRHGDWYRAARAASTSPSHLGPLLHGLLDRGHLDKVLSMASLMPAQDELHHILELLDPAGIPDNALARLPAASRTPHLRRLILFRELESNHLEALNRDLRLALATGNKEIYWDFSVELLAAGGGDRETEEGMGNLLFGQPSLTVWEQVCGACCTPSSAPWLNYHLSDARHFRNPRYLGAVQALWLSRQGRYEESFSALTPGSEPTPLMAAEILCRPLLALPSGSDRWTALAARSATMATHLPKVECLSQLQMKDFAAVHTRAAELFEGDPQPFWGLAAWYAARRRGDDGLRATWSRRLQTCIRKRTHGLWALRALQEVTP